jgi:predicted transcriptional regulator
VSKILKKLEKKEMIKKMKSIQAKNREVWLMMDIEPSAEVTGGIIG